MPGTLGLNAARQPEPGLYLSNQLVFYAADGLRDRRGAPVPVPGFALRALADGFGLSASVPLGPLQVNLGLATSVLKFWVSSDVPAVNRERGGLGDVRVQPLGAGWRSPHLDLVGAYGLYVPTSRVRRGGQGGFGRGNFAHEFSLGGTYYFDRQRRWYLTALVSYELNQRKIGIDITRGDNVLVQGGAGARVLGRVEMGVAGYGLWQVSDDQGADLAQRTRGSRDRALGLGPEVGILIPRIRTRLALRYEVDFAVRARPEGQIALLTATVMLWNLGPAPSDTGSGP